jgi:transcriptional regulator with XRE-family HTH domain
MNKLLAARIRQARKGANLSQSQLAAKIGAHVTSVSDWERGRNAPSARHLLSIAAATGTSIEHFQDGDGDDEEADPVSELTRAIKALVHAELAAMAEAGRAG